MTMVQRHDRSTLVDLAFEFNYIMKSFLLPNCHCISPPVL